VTLSRINNCEPLNAASRMGLTVIGDVCVTSALAQLTDIVPVFCHWTVRQRPSAMGPTRSSPPRHAAALMLPDFIAHLGTVLIGAHEENMQDFWNS